MKIAFLGPNGSYSSLAVEKYDSLAIKKECFNFYSVFECLKNDEVDKIILPIENSINGNVVKVLDLFLDYDFYIESEIVLEINHKLIVKKGINLEDIECIISHEQAINQCGKFISKNLPLCKIKYSESTSHAFDVAKNDFDAIIASGKNIKNDYVILKDNISDFENNYTRFVVLSKRLVRKDTNNKIYLAFSLKNEAGELLKTLNIFASNEINLTKIESRPLKRNLGEYVFYVEIEGSLSNRIIQNAIFKIEKEVKFLKILGEY